MKIQVVLLIVLALWVSSVRAEDRMQVRAYVSPSCFTCNLDQQMSMLTTIENAGWDPVVVFGGMEWGHMGGFVVHLEDESGNAVQPVLYDDVMIVPSTMEDPTYYLSLREGENFGVRKSFKAADLFPKAGTYRVWVTYQSPVPLEFARVKEHFLAREFGTIDSPKVTVIVR